MYVVLENTKPSRLVRVGGYVLSQLCLRRLFTPEIIELWKESFLESEGGVLLKAEPIEDKMWMLTSPRVAYHYLSYVIYSTFINPRDLAVRIEGKILGDIPGHLAINLFGSIYGDIDFDVMPSDKARSISDVYVNGGEQFRSMISDVIKLTGRRFAKNIKYVALGTSPDAQLYMTEWLVFYTPKVGEVCRILKWTTELLSLNVKLSCTTPMDQPVYALLVSASKQSNVSLVLSSSEFIFESNSPDDTKSFIDKLLGLAMNK